ncbi:MAG: hypothetical protein RQ745_12225, partial [Longimicrobiales bacterium]|nr:hypothetical protein [Longimicrobiales bacterium]
MTEARLLPPRPHRRRNARPAPASAPGRWFALLAVLAASSGCDTAGGDAGEPFTQRDSAGIAIAESRRPAWGEGEGWRLSPEP